MANEPMTPVKDEGQGVGVVFSVLALLLLPLLILYGDDWFDFQGNADIVSRQPIGSVLRMSAASGLSEHVVIETQEGFHPLLGTAGIAKGTPLFLEIRGSGRRYVCDAPRRLCLETTREQFSAAPQGSKP